MVMSRQLLTSTSVPYATWDLDACSIAVWLVTHGHLGYGDDLLRYKLDLLTHVVGLCLF